MNIFDGLLNTINKMNNTVEILKLLNYTNNEIITHNIMKYIAGIITYTPIDLKFIFHTLLKYKMGSQDELYFNKMYDFYKMRIFEDFTSASKSNYYYLDTPLKSNEIALFPP